MTSEDARGRFLEVATEERQHIRRHSDVQMSARTPIRRRSLNDEEILSRSHTSLRDRPTSRLSAVGVQRRASLISQLSGTVSESGKAKLCIQGLIFGNQYEGPYGKHISAIIHLGNALLAVGILLLIFSFGIFAHSPGIDALKIIACILFTIGFAVSVCTAAVYSRAYNNSSSGRRGRPNLQSGDIMLQTFAAITLFIAMTGIVMTPVCFGMGDGHQIFNSLKIVGSFYIVIGIFSFCGIMVYWKVLKKSNCSNIRQTSMLQRHSTNSHIPQIIVESDANSDMTGSDFAVSEAGELSVRRSSLVTPVTPSYIDAGPLYPPPYTEQDPNPSDAGSTVNTVSAAHSLVTLLQYAYADELETQTPPPPYEEVDRHSQIVTNQQTNVSHSLNPPPEVHLQEPTRRHSVSPVSMTSLYPPQAVSQTRTSSGLTVPDL